MEKTYSIGANPSILSELGFTIIELPELEDDNIHDWVITQLNKIEIDKLVIDFSNDLVKAIKIALHVRLSLDELREKTLVPIMFISSYSLNQVIAITVEWSHILATKGIYFASYETAAVQALEITGIKSSEFKKLFLDIVNILPDEKIGRHSHANQWGAFSLDKAAKTRALQSDSVILKAKRNLYFKYISAYNFDYNRLNPPYLKVFDNITLGNPERIPAIGRKILLIDDEADQGWEKVLRAIFRTESANDFVVINEKVRDYSSFSNIAKATIEKQTWDLFLIDVRLNGLHEEDVSDPKDFSGAKVLQKVKDLNEGNQVIMFTASNKAWVMKSLLDSAADGYYIKESPEYNFSLEFSRENYNNLKKEVDQCFKLSFLKEVSIIHRDCLQSIEANIILTNSYEYKSFYRRATSALEIALELLKKSAYDKKYLNLAYLTYYQILEDYAKQKENFCFDLTSGDAYVNQSTLVIEKSSMTWHLKFVKKDVQFFDYFVSGLEINKSFPTSLSQISFILAFQFHKDEQTLKHWGRLNQLRNTKAVHGNSDCIAEADLFELLKIVKLFLIH